MPSCPPSFCLCDVAVDASVGVPRQVLDLVWGQVDSAALVMVLPPLVGFKGIPVSWTYVHWFLSREWLVILGGRRHLC